MTEARLEMPRILRLKTSPKWEGAEQIRSAEQLTMDRVISRSLDATVLGGDLMLVVFECHRASKLVEVVV